MIQFVSKLYAVMVIYAQQVKLLVLSWQNLQVLRQVDASPALHQNSQPWHMAYDKIRYANHQIRFWTLTFGHNPKV